MPTTMRSFFILALFCLIGWSNSKKCPAQYKRFSVQHTFCIAPNRNCQNVQTGVSRQDKELILRLHNQFRSKVAMGNERRSLGGPLPQAADMMEMVWDDELAILAQKWAQNCIFEHDCNECSEVENFPVGQNLAENYGDWTTAITALYDEVEDYYKSWLSYYESHDDPKTGHFTQLIWSKSWRVGCGYSYNNLGGGRFQRYYACNYGPAGNTPGKPVYKPGQPCSACPTNTHCSNSFPGLCTMNDPNTAPAYPINRQGLLFYCGASSSDPDCKTDVYGQGTFYAVNSVGGNYYSIVINGGESATIAFTKPIVPHAKSFCIQLTFRKGPMDASYSDQSSLKPTYKMEVGTQVGKDISLPTTSFGDSFMGLGWGRQTQVSFTFSAPTGAGQHVLDIRRVIAFDGSCSSRMG